MYMWSLVGHDTSEGPVSDGIGSDLAAIMRVLEPLLEAEMIQRKVVFAGGGRRVIA